MNQDLLETLTGNFLDGTPVSAVPAEERIAWSIRDNLTRLFTARAGLLPHLPDYGLPDITEVYRQMPHGISRLKEAMESVIAAYEPRMKNVRVTYLAPSVIPDQAGAAGRQGGKAPFVFEFTITGEVRNVGKISFCSTLPSAGNPRVSRIMKKE